MKTYLIFALLLASGFSAFAAPPDLTNGGVPNNQRYSNLGPTGLLGWVYYENYGDSGQSRQIRVQAVDAGSPAAGKLVLGDVILGADGTGANPVNFTADARRSFSNAINDAEARTPAELRVLRWRAGMTTIQTLTLRTMGAYSATAPYNCPKSALILEEGLQAMMSGESAGYGSFGTLALLAGNNPANPNNAARRLRAQNEARALIPSAAEIAKMTSGDANGLFSGRDPWSDGHQLIVLTEYYLLTNDALVLPAIDALSKCIGYGQNTFGSYSHRYATKWRDGSPNGPMRNGYGTVNNTAMLGWLGLLLTRECGVSYPDLNPAIARASRFFGYYSGKGAVPYGEHEASWGGHENNGKSGLAAVCFELESTRTAEQKFFAKMATAATSARDEGHTGPYFNYVWSPIGAAAGGEAAATAHFNGIRWMLDLNRRWNGSFVFDSLSPESANNGGSYSGFSKSTPPLLLYALPLRQLHITGRGHDSQRWLSIDDVAEATAVDHYSATTRSTSQLVADLGSWSPRVQRRAAEELGNRSGETTALLPALHAMATDPQGTSRAGACFALGHIGHPASAGILASLLTDPANLVRYAATAGLTEMPQTVRQPHLNTVLAAAASNAAPLFPLNEEDPAHLTHAQLGPLLFDPNGMVPTDFGSVNKSFLFPAIRAIASNPVGRCRSTVARIYNALNQTDYLALADTVVNSAYELTPADKMFGYGDRLAAQRLLERFNAAEGVPLSVLAIKDDMFGSITPDALGTLQLYAGGSKTVVPDTGVEAAINFLIQSGYFSAEAQAALAAITSDPNAATLPSLKSIQAVIPDAPTLTLPANLTVLRTTSNDFAKGDSIYTWRKIRGAGNVVFSPNGTAAAKDTAVIFDGIPGQYLFEVKMSDSKNLTEVFSTVAVTLNNTGGSLPPNTPPVANSQSPAVPQAIATPITLTGSDPEGYVLNYRLASQPTSGTLAGSAPFLVYTSNSNYVGPDSFTFEAIDSEGQVSTAMVNITVTANSSFPTAIYEPFNYPTGALNGDTGTSEVGFSGAWAAATSSNVVAGSLAYGNLPTLGGSIGNLSGSNYGGRRLLSTTALTANGLLNDGSTLWFSVVMGYGTTANLTNDRLGIALANSNFDTGTSQYNIVNESPQLGSGLGVTLGSFEGNGDQTNGKFVATHFRDSTSGSSFNGNVFGTVPRTMIGVSQQRLIVGKFTWSATSDKLEIFEPDTNLNLGPVTSTLTVNVNQSTFDTLTWRRNGAVTMDEIRFGSNYSTVLNGNAPMTADTGAPAPATMAFHEIPTAVSPDSIRMVAVSAYDTNQVEYYFSCTAGGGQDSGWQDSPSYTNTGLTPGVLYSYRVKARDKSPARNETALSSIASATISTQTTVPNIVSLQRAAAESIITMVGLTVGSVTLDNSTGSPAGTVLGQNPVGNQTLPLGSAIALVVSGGDFLTPTPNPATFAVAPAAINSSTITMTATAGSDPSGVQYLFTETSGNPGATNSAWQDSPVFSDNGLNPSTQYSYTVTLRDKSPNASQTVASAPASATTNPVPAAPVWYWDGGTSDFLTNGNGASAGGTGTWDNVLLNWDVGTVGYTSWNNAAGKTAVFGGTAGTVTIAGGGVTVGNVQFTTADYLIHGDPLTVNGPGPVQINVSATLQSALLGNVGLTKSGAGIVTLSGTNSFSGGSITSAGTLLFQSLGSKPSAGQHTFGSGTTIGLGVGFGDFTTADLDHAFSGTTAGNLSNVTLHANTNIGIDTTWGSFTYSSNIGTVSRGLTKLGSNNLTLSGTNSAYTGITTIVNGTLAVGTLANSGSSSSIGNFATAGATGLVLSGGNFNYTGASTTINRGFTATGASRKMISVGTGVNLTLGASVKNETATGSNGLTFSATGAGSSITISSMTIASSTSADFNISTNNPTVTIQNLNITGGNVIVQRTGSALLNIGNINGTTASGWLGNINVTGVISGYTGNLVLGNDVTLSGLSTFSVPIDVQQGGTYTFNSIKNIGGGASALGAPTTVANGTINFGNGTNSPILKYIGTGDTTNRTLNLRASGGTMNLEQAGTGLLRFTANTTAAAGNKTLNLTGSTTGTGELSGAIVNGSSGTTSLSKSGSGTWTLSGNNTYSGATNVIGGTLVCSNATALGGGVLNLDTGAKLQLNFAGTRQVASLSFDSGTAMANGTYGSTSSTATNKNDTYFAGIGTVTVGPLAAVTTTTLALTAGNTPSPTGSPLTFTATVTGSAPTGSVTFLAGNTALATNPLNAANQATLTTSTLPIGTNPITARYDSDVNNQTSTSSALAIQINEVLPATPTNLLAAPANQRFGLTWTASERATSYLVKRSLTHGGLYTVIANPTSTSYEDLAVVNGTPYFYVVSAINSAGESADSNQVTGIPGPQPSTTTLTFSPSASGPYGTPVTFTATVTVSGGPATGTVTFMNGSTLLGTGVLSAGIATFTTSTLAVASHSITATYAGDATFVGSVSTPAAYGVTPIPLAITGVSASNKIYDGNTIANLTGGVLSSGVINGETVNLVAGTGNFASSNIGNHTIAASGFTLAGTHAGNYTLSAQPTIPNATITARLVQILGTRAYDATTTASAADLTISNMVNGDDLTLIGSANVGSKDVGTQPLLINHATAARVQSATGFSTGSTSTSFTAALTTAPTAGNTLVAVISTRGNTTNRVTNITSTGATWSRVVQSVNTSGSSTTEIWSAPVGPSASSTVTITTAAGRCAAVVVEYSGLLTANAVDQIASSTGATSTAPVTGTTPLTTQANELWIAGIGYRSSAPVLSSLLNSFSSVNSAQSNSGTAGNNAEVYALERIVSTTGTASSGGALSASVAWSGAIATFKTHPVTGFSLSGAAAANYALTGMTGSLTITPRTLTITADDQTKPYGQNLTFGSGVTQFTRSGLVSGETIGSISLTCAGGALAADAGAYPITPSAATGGSFNPTNYAITYVSGLLTVSALSSTTTLSSSGTPTTYGDPVTLTATVSPSPVGGTIQFFDESVALGSPVSISSGQAQMVINTLPAGSHSITATFSGSTNHSGSISTALTQTVNKATPTITTPPSATAITDGQALANSTLSGGAGSVSGSFTFTIPSTIPPLGTASHSVTFNPSDVANYHTATTNVAVTVNNSQTPYEAWASNPTNGLTAGINAGPLDDPDRDGFSNLMELVLGGAPMVPSQVIQPKLTRSGENWVFSYQRSHLSEASITQIVEYGDGLNAWTPATVPIETAGVVMITPGATSDLVEVTIPPQGSKGFARLKVLLTP